MDSNLFAFKAWLADQLSPATFTVAALVGDASFRTYYRVTTEDASYIAMVAPPQKERTTEFVAIAQTWQQQGVQVPTIFGWEPQQGFVLISDFGDDLLLDKLTPLTVDVLYQQAMHSLAHIQNTTMPLPLFNENHLRLELSYFQEWFLQKLLNIPIGVKETHLLEHVTELLLGCFMSQPQVPIHRDYHSRNLMLLAQGELGIIDFQDAMLGPITYDLVSLLKDCYISWEPEQISSWLHVFYQSCQKNQGLTQDFAQFQQWFDWTGLQRHLKVLGIFSRLNLRDGKPRYLLDMPRIMNYVLQVTARYPALSDFDAWLRTALALPLENLWQQAKIKVA